MKMKKQYWMAGYLYILLPILISTAAWNLAGVINGELSSAGYDRLQAQTDTLLWSAVAWSCDNRQDLLGASEGAVFKPVLANSNRSSCMIICMDSKTDHCRFLVCVESEKNNLLCTSKTILSLPRNQSAARLRENPDKKRTPF